MKAMMNQVLPVALIVMVFCLSLSVVNGDVTGLSISNEQASSSMSFVGDDHDSFGGEDPGWVSPEGNWKNTPSRR